MFSEGGDNTPTPTNDNQEQQTSSDPTPSSTNPFEDKLKSIVNEKGEPKYKDLDSALDALKHSQEFIPQVLNEKKSVEQQLQELQQELEKRKSVEEVVESLTGKQNSPQNDEGKTTPQGSGLDETKVQEMLENMLNQRTQEQQQAANLQTVVQTLNESYGEQAKEVIRNRAKELNTTPTELEKLARQNPNMALSLLGGGNVNSTAPSKQTQTPPRNPPKNELPAPKKGLITGGATRQEIMDEWSAVKQGVYSKYGVEN